MCFTHTYESSFGKQSSLSCSAQEGVLESVVTCSKQGHWVLSRAHCARYGYRTQRVADPNRIGDAVAPRPGAALGGNVLTGVLSLSFSVRLVLFTTQ